MLSVIHPCFFGTFLSQKAVRLHPHPKGFTGFSHIFHTVNFYTFIQLGQVSLGQGGCSVRLDQVRLDQARIFWVILYGQDRIILLRIKIDRKKNVTDPFYTCILPVLGIYTLRLLRTEAKKTIVFAVQKVPTSLILKHRLLC